MTIQNPVNPVMVAEKELLLVASNYEAKPVTVNKDTIANLQRNADGRYIIPQGTYLKGPNTSLFLDPTQIAVEATIADVLDSVVTADGIFKVTATTPGASSYKLVISVGTKARPSVTLASKVLTITLGMDTSASPIVPKSTYEDLVTLINSDDTVNNFVKASIVDGKDGSIVAVPAASVDFTGNVDGTVNTIDGILLHSVDVTDGEWCGTLVYGGNINIDNLPEEPSVAIMQALPRIKFGRK